jgi:phosphoglycolate phosphatase-like HAD superfamily hydrolase
MKICFCDLDGPLLDVSEKYYRAYADLIMENGGQPISRERYWSLKRQRVSSGELLQLSAAQGLSVATFAGSWATRVESKEYLRYDRLQSGALEAVEAIARRYELALVTLRRSRDLLMWQLGETGLLASFDAILSSGEDRIPRWSIKHDLITAYYAGGTRSYSWFIGDTETDIEAGRNLGARTIAIFNGIRTEALLRCSSPDILLPAISEIASTPIYHANPVR